MSHEYIFLDLETTKLGKLAEITQIGAVHGNGKKFICFIIPDGEIDPGASNVNGFTKHRGKLYQNGTYITDAVSPAEGLTLFFNWIKKNKSNKDVWLVAHNAYNFDAPVLINNFIRYEVASMSEIEKTISGFCDSLVSFRKSFNYSCNKLAYLLQKFKIRQEQSHDALEDAQDLKALIEKVCRKNNMAVRQFLPNYLPPSKIYLD